MHFPSWSRIAIISAFFLVVFASASAQQEIADNTGAAPESVFEALWITATDACIGKPVGFICNGGAALQAEPAGLVANTLAATGALVDVAVVESLRTPALDASTGAGGIAWLRLPAPIEMTGLLIGDVAVQNVTPPDFPAWQSITIRTAPAETSSGLPDNAFVAQSPFNQSTNIVVNGISLVLNGTVMVQTNDNETLFIALAGGSSIIAFGQERPLLAGQQISVAHDGNDFSRPAGPPNNALPLETARILDLPVGLFDRPHHLPQPGFVSTRGPVNLRATPTTDGALLFQVSAGEVLAVLGRNPAGDWYHVRLTSGETGWMFADLLIRQVTNIGAVYTTPPLPPQRYGDLGNVARVQAPAGANVRQFPDVGFAVLGTLPPGTDVELLARSPYSPWVKVDADGFVGWVALITLETQAFIDALPVDNNVPPPPPPTRVPGSFDNAFPDPQGGN